MPVVSRVDLRGHVRGIVRRLPRLRELIAQRDALLAERSELRATRRELRNRLKRAQSRIRTLESELRDPRQMARDGRRPGLKDLVPGVDVDRLGYVFIVAYGRSGSTLLQGILNSIPGYDIHGENVGALHDLFSYHSKLEQERNLRWRPSKPTYPHYGIERFATKDSIRLLREVVIGTVLRPRAGSRVTGFKEIRWFYSDWDCYLDFLIELFPGARFVINTRSHEAVARSKWWAGKPGAMEQLATYEARLDEIAARLGSRAYRVRYDDYVADHESLVGLFNWLGEPFDRTRIDAIMEKPHSY